jgi:hypothetical protein
MTTITNGESGLSVRNKINEAINKVDGAVPISSVNIDGGTIDGAAIGATTPSTGAFADLTAARLNVGANLAWNASTDTYTANTTPSTVTAIHQGMKRCVLNADGSLNYYLNPSDSTQKLDGTAANIDGTDGNVMVEIPKFYFRHVLSGNTNTWEISDLPLAGYQVHPAFIKAGVEVSHRYIGAYDACYLDATDSTYKSGLNLDDMTGNLDLANDKMASVSGVYPLVGVTRAECRTLAANNGTGWHQLDFALWSAIQMLYLVEYGTFSTQSELGDGNINGSYLASSSNQNDSPHTIAGASNALGNASTDGTQPSAGAKPGTAYMSYRGIENWYGNCWTWADGINVNEGSSGNVHVTNDYEDFADGTTTGYTLLSSSFPTGSGYIQNILNTGAYFLSGDNTGGSSTTYLTDYHYATASASRVVLVGGSASNGAIAGGFCLNSASDAGDALRVFGARLCF